jgi:hypothetical protein
MRFGMMWALIGAAALAGGGLGRAIELPAKAQALRDDGVPAAEVATAIRASKDHGLTAAETTDLLDAAKGEKIDNLGSFVKGKLDEGLRGRDLANAIHEEQGRRGMGKPEDGEKGGKGKAPTDGEQGGEQGGGKEGKGKSGKGGH